jgi:putative DNA primase/helicase
MLEGTAAEIVDFALGKPELPIQSGDLPATAAALRDLLAA